MLYEVRNKVTDAVVIEVKASNAHQALVKAAIYFSRTTTEYYRKYYAVPVQGHMDGRTEMSGDFIVS